MARKITKEMTEAFFAGTKRSMDNTQIIVQDDGTVTMYLHGWAIARRKGGRVEISNAGYKTQTTKERLSGICSKIGAGIYQKRYRWFVQPAGDLESVEMPDNEWIVIDGGSAMEQFVWGLKDLA
jgi:hypothetical protein